MRLRILWLVAMGIPAFGQDPLSFFESRVRPVLVKNCYPCHTKSEMGGFRVDSAERIRHAVKPGAPAESLLLELVEHRNPQRKMPPQGKLKESEIADLRTWIAAGAVYPKAGPAPKVDPKSFWSFQPVKAVTPPAGPGAPIDRFLAARWKDAGVAPAPPADRRTLLRRVTFDLTGLPPTPEEMAAFLADRSAGAFAKVVDRLLASPHYGERWARHWLDVARYSDGQQGARDDDPYPNAWRYRDWVVQALNQDLTYDTFLKSQIAADLLPGQEHLAALGFQTIGESDNDRLDVTTRAMLGLTVGCAQCHDHKFDPIPTKDYYSLLGVFKSSVVGEHPLVAPAVVKAYQDAKAAADEKQAELKRFLERQTALVLDVFAAQTADYLVAVRGGTTPADLDAEVLGRWKAFLQKSKRDHPFFAPWFALPSNASAAEVRQTALALQKSIQTVIADKKAVDDRNYVKLGGIEGLKDVNRQISTLVDALPVERFYFWRDIASSPFKSEDIKFDGGVYYFTGKALDRFLEPRVLRYANGLRAEAEALKKAIPPLYPFWHVLKDGDKPKNIPVAIRGNAETPGEEAPRRFLSVLCEGEPPAFTQGSGRLELANAIADARNPLTARVAVNRLWQHHFGQGLVRSPGNFGQLGDRPTHSELLDYLAARLVANGWSLKAMHREILLTEAYQRASAASPAAREKDPDNLLLSHANVRERLDAEALRDAILAVAGTLDRTVGGAPAPFDDKHRRRTLYVTVSRSKPDRTLAAFDFPDPNAAADTRMVTVGPMQRLFFMNAPFVAEQAQALAARLTGSDAARIAAAYELLYGRPATAEEVKLGLAFVQGQPARWPQYTQVLLSAAEFSTIQ
ncbi:MAG: PSD1 and planctomycete cytochrome C domain-containing protein [Acidobacteriota bacterium]